MIEKLFFVAVMPCLRMSGLKPFVLNHSLIASRSFSPLERSSINVSIDLISSKPAAVLPNLSSMALSVIKKRFAARQR
ncbi:MAG: PTPA-CTERM sorting domain-containing protein [Nitrospirae bacterium]|nr:MAG: PTPA-CTERM sorting domain-containing protein [Nitrospirota bacterium]